MEELIRKWRLEVAELQIHKMFYVNLQNFEPAAEARDRQKVLQKCIDELQAHIDEVKKTALFTWPVTPKINKNE